MTPVDKNRTDEFVLNGELAEALRVYRQFYNQNPADEDAILGIAQCAWMLDNTDVALEFFVKLLMVNHQHPWGYLGKGILLLQANAIEQGLHSIQKALDLDNPPSEMRIDAAAALNAHGFPEEAVDALIPVRSKYFDNPDFRLEWISALLTIEDYTHPDILRILDEELAKFGEEENTDLVFFYQLCNFVRCEKLGILPKSQELQNAILCLSPELTERASGFLDGGSAWIPPISNHG